MVAADALFCLIIAISDGDTLRARCDAPDGYEEVTVRISAIDAPEKRQAFGAESKRALSDLCFGQMVTIKPVDRDRYGRTVADVQCRGQDVGEHQVRQGMAWVFNRYAQGYGGLYGLQAIAQDKRKGLWQDANPMPPWDWRKLKQ